MKAIIDIFSYLYDIIHYFADLIIDIGLFVLVAWGVGSLLKSIWSLFKKKGEQ